MIEVPQSFVVGQECQKVTWQNGFRKALGEASGWAGYASTTAKGTVWLAATGAQGPWFLALDHPGVKDELGLVETDMPGPGIIRYRFDSLGDLYPAMARIYRLAASLPDVPLSLFKDKTKNLPQTTEVERLVVQRIGQDIFRAGLMEYWEGRCPLTGITEPALLRASHIVAWKDCSSDAQRLDVHNGLLLSALWDAAFDRGLVTFTDDGKPEFRPNVEQAARTALCWSEPIPLTDKHREHLAWHRIHRFSK